MRFLLFLVLLSCSNINNKQYDMVLYAGRFQPFHHGHYRVVNEAKMHGKHILIAISQAKNGKIDNRNPFTGDQRYSTIKDTLVHDKINNVDVVQLDNIDGDWSKDKDILLKKWDENFVNIAYSKYKQIFNKTPNEDNIAFIYYDRDGVDYDKRFEKYFSILKIEKPFEYDVSATKIRKSFFKEDKIDDNLPFGTKKLLKNLKQQ
jgi:bifunctional NMN adenylyltransferase/nudix hydrolase